MAFVEYYGEQFEVKDNTLSLRDQGITDISKIKGLNRLPNLISLNYLEGNGIEKIQGLDNLASLEKLNLSKNQISEIKGVENKII